MKYLSDDKSAAIFLTKTPIHVKVDYSWLVERWNYRNTYRNKMFIKTIWIKHKNANWSNMVCIFCEVFIDGCFFDFNPIYCLIL